MLPKFGLAALLGATSALAVQCTLDSKCPEDSPCCSTYGECGVGAFCLGGCDPRMSHSLESCVPAPVCQDRNMKFSSLDRVVDIGKYLGDADKADWVAQGEPVIYKDNLLLTMPKNSVGTVLSSTVYMWYGNVKARFKTSRGAGVVTAFILFSDVKDEIDYEFVGVDLETAQTNYYFQGITNYENAENITDGVTDTFSNFHDYEIRWTPDKIEWWLDGKLGRTKEKKDTWNETAQAWAFPQTPARVQLSLWPGGLATNAKGTVDWAGGEIDWDAPDIKNNGYYYATFSSVDMECYNAKSAPGTNNGKSYTYSDTRATNDTIVDGDKRTTLASLQATGEDMDKGKKKKASSSKSADKSASSTASKTDDDDAEETEPATIPGGGSAGSSGSGSEHDSDSSSDKDSSSGSGSGSSSGSDDSDDSSDDTTKADTTNCDPKDFNQDCSSDSSDKKSDNGKSGGTRTSASALAIIIAGFAVYWL